MYFAWLSPFINATEDFFYLIDSSLLVILNNDLNDNENKMDETNIQDVKLKRHYGF